MRDREEKKPEQKSIKQLQEEYMDTFAKTDSALKGGSREPAVDTSGEDKFNESVAEHESSNSTPLVEGTKRKYRKRKKEPIHFYPRAPRVVQIVKKPKTFVNHSYRDFSCVPPELGDRESPGRLSELRFASKVHHMLSDESNNHCITWMTHGRAFKITSPKLFEEVVLPKYFGKTPYSRFTTELRVHGFKLLTSGTDAGCYYHECFLRGLPHLCKYMPIHPLDPRRKTPDPENEPDFYAINAKYPLLSNDARSEPTPHDAIGRNDEIGSGTAMRDASYHASSSQVQSGDSLPSVTSGRTEEPIVGSGRLPVDIPRNLRLRSMEESKMNTELNASEQRSLHPRVLLPRQLLPLPMSVVSRYMLGRETAFTQTQSHSHRGGDLISNLQLLDGRIGTPSPISLGLDRLATSMRMEDLLAYHRTSITTDNVMRNHLSRSLLADNMDTLRGALAGVDSPFWYRRTTIPASLSLLNGDGTLQRIQQYRSGRVAMGSSTSRDVPTSVALASLPDVELLRLLERVQRRTDEL